MKFKIIIQILSLSLLFIACTQKKEEKIQEKKVVMKEYRNLDLTDFTKEFIALYLNDPQNEESKDLKQEIVVDSYHDSINNYLSIFAKDPDDFDFYGEHFIGQTRFLGHRIRVYGDVDSMFFKIKEKNKLPVKYIPFTEEYDPNVWVLCLNKDGSFCKMKTIKLLIEDDISDIQKIASKYFRNPKRIDDDIFEYSSVGTPPKLSFSDDSLRRIINQNFKKSNVVHNDKYNEPSISIELLVNKAGKATFSFFDKKTGDAAIDNEAKRVAEIICKYAFTPASHRGEIVRAYYPITFTKEDIIQPSPTFIIN